MQLLLIGILVLGVLATDRTAVVYGQDDGYCFGKDEAREQMRHFGILSPYEIVKGTHMEKQYLVPNCEAKKIWIYQRHGTRLPMREVIEQAPRLDELRNLIVKNYETRHSKRTVSALCDVDYFNLKLWKWNSSVTVDQADYLTSQGYADMKGPIKLFQRLFPHLLPKEFDSKHYLFRHVNDQRTPESFKPIVEALFGVNNNAWAEPADKVDWLLMPYNYCVSWKEHNYKGPGTEDYKFRESALWLDTIKDISARLGFEYSLDSNDIELMFFICRYEQAQKLDRTSPWCAAFLPEHVYVLEWESDLKIYYKLGFGYDENSRLNCRIVRDMLQHLNSPTAPNAIINLAHSAGFQLLLTALGYAKDDVSLTATNYHNMTQRLFKTSTYNPFASNLAVVKYECNELAEHRENVIFFMNQNAIFFDWCKAGLCSLSEVMKRYGHFLKVDCVSYSCRSGNRLESSSSSTMVMTSSASVVIPLLIASIVYLIH